MERTLRAALVAGAILSASSLDVSVAQDEGLQVEIEYNNTGGGDDDYLCWSPRPARIRLLNGADLAGPVRRVRIAGTPLSAVSTGALQFQKDEGSPISRSNFSPSDEIEVELRTDGSWTPFFAMGKAASTANKDVAIVVREEAGADAGFLPVMVRVRKDARRLTVEERAKFLQAVRDLHQAQGFEKYWRAHAAAFFHDIHFAYTPPYTPLFLAWHRALLLNFERELQAFDASVALPYWKFDEPSFLAGMNPETTIFSRDFLGEHNPGTGLVIFASGHPWENWRTSADTRPLFRLLFPDTLDPFTGQIRGPIRPGELDDVLDAAMHRVAAGEAELGYHNGAHSAVRGWLGEGYSPADPVFFLLHGNVDRAYAHWQAAKGTFDDSGLNESSYHAVGSYPGDGNYLDGSYALDQMWPWRPGINGWPQGMYFQMPTGVNGPDLAALPTPASQIDYLDLAGDGVASGACYDDITFADSSGANP